MSRGVVLIVPSRSVGRVARPLVSGTCRTEAPVMPSLLDPDPRQWRGNPLQGTRGCAYHPTY